MGYDFEGLVSVSFEAIKLDREDLRAVLFDIEGYDVWIPRSLIHHINETDMTIEVPSWFAYREGLL
jgi:hypothetical protein